MTDLKPPKVPAKRPRGRQSTMTPTRLGNVAQAVLQGDSIKASCHSALVPEPTYVTWRQRGEAAIVKARQELDDDDVEGRIWAWIEDGGGFKQCGPTEWYWTAKPPTWLPQTLTDRWMTALFVMVIAYARARSEQVYRAAITRAAQGSNGQPGDWKAAQFMLTHSFGWQSADRIELTGKDGGAIEMQAGEEQVLAGLAALAAKRRTIEVQESK